MDSVSRLLLARISWYNRSWLIARFNAVFLSGSRSCSKYRFLSKGPICNHSFFQIITWIIVGTVIKKILVIYYHFRLWISMNFFLIFKIFFWSFICILGITLGKKKEKKKGGSCLFILRSQKGFFFMVSFDAISLLFLPKLFNFHVTNLFFSSINPQTHHTHQFKIIQNL